MPQQRFTLEMSDPDARQQHRQHKHSRHRQPEGLVITPE